MWPFKSRSKDEWEEWEIETYQEERHEGNDWDNSNQDGYNPYWQEEIIQTEKGEGFSFRSIIITLGVFLYIIFLTIGGLTTDYHNGRGYVVSETIRVERAYVENVSPFYEVLQRSPERIYQLESSIENPIDLQYQLTQLSQQILALKEQEKKRQGVPAPYQAFHQYLYTLADKEITYIQDLVAYYQDKRQERIPALQGQFNDILYVKEQAKEQMEAINERINSNTKTPQSQETIENEKHI